MQPGIENLRSLLGELGPDGASAALFAPGLALGVSDSDFPDMVQLWGFDLKSGESITMVKPVPPMPTDDLLERLDQETVEHFIAERDARIEANRPPQGFPQDMEINQWIKSIQDGVEDSEDPEVLEVLRNPSEYEWDAISGVVESIAPYTEASSVDFQLRRLNLA